MTQSYQPMQNALYGASLTHAHTCAYVSPLFFHGKESLFYETPQPGECSVGFDSHSCSLFRQLCTGELVTQRIEEGATVGIGPVWDFRRWKER